MRDFAVPLAVAVLASVAPGQIVFQPPAGYTAQAQTLSTGGYAVGDVTGDGLADVILADALGGKTQLLVNQGDGTLGPAATLFVAQGAVTSLELADLDADGALDLVVVSPGLVDVRLGAGDGSFAPAFGASPSPTVHAAVVGDVTGDGVPDLVTTATGQVFSGSPSAHVLPGLGDGTFDAPITLYAEAGSLVMTSRPLLADADGDGVQDVAFTTTVLAQPSTLRVHFSAGGEATHALPQPAAGLGLADFDGDGLADVAFADGEGGTVAVALNDGAGGLGPWNEHAAGDNPHGLLAADLDGDGRVDLATPNQQSDDVTVLRGQGDGTFVPVVTVSGTPEASGLRAADFDGDGLADLALSVSPEIGPIAVVLNHTYDEGEGFCDEGGAGAGLTGYPILLAYGTPVPGQQVAFRLENAPSGSTSWLVVGLSALGLPLHGATLGPAPDLLVGPVAPSADGAAALAGAWPAGAPPLRVQYWLANAKAHGGFAATSTVLVTP